MKNINSEITVYKPNDCIINVKSDINVTKEQFS